MNVLRRIAMGVGGIVVVALCLTLAAPKTVHAVLNALVTVTNTAANPVPTESVDNPGRNSFLYTLCTAFGSQAGSCFNSSNAVNTPSNARFVIQYVEGRCDVSGPVQSSIGVGPLGFSVLANRAGGAIPQLLTFHLDFDRFDNGAGGATGTTSFSFQQATNIYVDPNSQFGLDGLAEVTSNQASFICFANISGYTVFQ